MARFSGYVGFEKEQREVEPGIWEPSDYESNGMIEKLYTGDLLKHTRKWQSTTDGSNDDLVLSNRISIVCDNYMFEHWPSIKYVKWNNAYWKVNYVEIKRPRIVLNLGGIWHGFTAETA